MSKNINAVIAFPAFLHSFASRFENISVYVEKASIEKADVVIFSGGEDISPEIYNEEWKGARGVNPTRDKIELEALEHALNLNKKILGVCRGHQLINSYLGGKLIQNMSHPGGHKLEDIDSTFLNPFEKIGVNSLHHQAVDVPGKNMRVTATFKGIIEATENEQIVTVQFHPEFMHGKETDSFFESIFSWIKQ